VWDDCKRTTELGLAKKDVVEKLIGGERTERGWRNGMNQRGWRGSICSYLSVNRPFHMTIRLLFGCRRQCRGETALISLLLILQVTSMTMYRLDLRASQQTSVGAVASK